MDKTQTKVEEKSNVVKLPIFISGSSEVINDINSFILSKDYSEKVEVVVISPDIQQKLNENYLLNQMAETERMNILKEKANESQKRSAERTTITLIEMFKKYNGIKSSDMDFCFPFNKLILKDVIQYNQKRKISHKEVDNLIEFLLLHEMITPIDLEEKQHKRSYSFSLGTKAKIDNIETLIGATKEKITSMKDDIKEYNLLKKSWEKQLQSEIAKADELQKTFDGSSVNKLNSDTKELTEEEEEYVEDERPIQALSQEEIDEMNQQEHSNPASTDADEEE